MHCWNASPSFWMRRRRECRPSAICFLLRPLWDLTAGVAATTRPRVRLGALSTPGRPAALGAPLPPTPPPMSMGTSVAPHGPSEASRYHPPDAALGRATWSVGHYGEVFGVTAPEAYAPHMMDQEYTPEDDPGSFLGPGWEEEALGAEAFQEPPESPANRAIDNRYRVPLIPQ